MGLLAVPVQQDQAGPAGDPTGSLPRGMRCATPGQPRAEKLPSQRHHPAVVDIAGHREDHPLGGVAAQVEGAQLVTGHRRDRIDAADHRPTERMVTEDCGKEHVADGVLGIVVAHRDLLEHDVALEFDVRRRADSVENDIGHQVYRQLEVVIEHVGVVAGVLPGGESVQLATDGVDRPGDVDRASRRGALEQQMLQEVSRAGDSAALVARADVHPDPDGGGPRRWNELGDHPQTTRQHGAAHRAVPGRSATPPAPVQSWVSCWPSRHRRLQPRTEQATRRMPPRRRGSARSCRDCRCRRSRPSACRPP